MSFIKKIRAYIQQEDAIFYYISGLTFIFFYLSAYREGSIFFTLAMMLVISLRRFEVSTVLKALILSVLIMPGGGYFNEARLLSIFGFHLTPDKLFNILSIVILSYQSLASFLRKKKITNKLSIASIVTFILASSISFFTNRISHDPLLISILYLNGLLSILIILNSSEIDLKSILKYSYGAYLFSLIPTMVEIFGFYNPFEYAKAAFNPDLGAIKIVHGAQSLHLTLVFIIIAFLPLTYILFKNNAKLFISLIGLQTFIALHTYSRSGLLALCVVVTGVLILWFLNKEITKRVKYLSITYGAFVFAFVFIGMYFSNFFINFSLRNDVELPFNLDEFYVSHNIVGDKEGYRVTNDASYGNRALAIKHTQEILKTHPVEGIGLGQFQKSYKIAPDSLFVQIVAETGLLGIMSFITLMGVGMFYSIRTRSSIFILSLFGVLIAGISIEVLSYSHSSIIFWLVILVPAVYLQAPSKEKI